VAVYTQVPAEKLAEFLERYDLGALTVAKGIAEGIENTNYLIATERGRFVLTLYEQRVSEADLPYFLSLTRHVAERGIPAPRPIPDRDGKALQSLAGRPACLVEFLPGISISEPTLDLCERAGMALGAFHHASADFSEERENTLGHAGRAALAARCLGEAAMVDPGLPALIEDELAFQSQNWPAELPRATIHADLFPDNVLALDGRVTGLIDFYFACTDIRAYDLAVMDSAWCFSNDGKIYFAKRAASLLKGYLAAHPISAAEMAAMPVLRRAAALRFLLTRTYDWLNTPADALVTPKDPMAFARRLAHYRAA
jgi:homoserine kinase type II